MMNPTEMLPSLEAIRVLIIDDDQDEADALLQFFERSGFRAAHGATGGEGLALAQSFAPDVVLLDLVLPDADGIGLIGMLGQQGERGVIIVSGRADETDRVAGLEVGADDYICKPVRPRELLARTRAVSRRVKQEPGAKPESAPEMVHVGTVRVDLQTRTAHRVGGRAITLTSAEFDALATLIAANGQTVSRDRLSEAALHHPWRPEDRGVDQLMFGLRQKIGETGGKPWLHCVRGVGYILTTGTDETAAALSS